MPTPQTLYGVGAAQKEDLSGNWGESSLLCLRESETAKMHWQGEKVHLLDDGNLHWIQIACSPVCGRAM